MARYVEPSLDPLWLDALAMVLSIKDIGDELPLPETWTLNTARIWNFVIGMVYRIANRK